MAKRTNMKLNEYSYNQLKKLKNGSIDENLNFLIDAVEKHMPTIPYGARTKSVNAYQKTYDRLDGFRITYGESRDNIITRMLIIYNQLENIEPMEIPFRLTSPLNKNLIIEGICTETEIIIPNEHHSVEYTAWNKLLDWEEISSLILDHYEERISFNKPNYNLDINY